MKKTKHLPRCGVIKFEDRIHDGEGVRIARTFLTRLLEQVCKLAVRYYDKDTEERDHFLRFHERMMYSQFAVAVNELTTLHCSEQSLSRNTHGSAGSGRADLWARYGNGPNKVNVLIELKRHTFAFTKGVHSRKLKDGLGLLVNQTNSLKKQARSWDNSAILIGLDVILPYGERKNETRFNKFIRDHANDPHQRGNEFVQGVFDTYRNINFVSAWFPPSRMTTFETANGWEYNPYVGFAGRIVSLPKNKGKK